MEDTAENWLKFITLFVIDIAAIVGNALMLTAGARTPSLRVYQNAFIFNIALADILEATLIMPVVLTNIATSKQVLGDDWCRVFAALKVTITLTSVYSLAGVSIQRYIYVIKRRNGMNNAKKAILGVTFVWTISIIFSITPFFGWGRIGFDQDKDVCTALFHQTATYTVTVFSTALFLNLFVMVFCYTSIFIKFRRQNNMVKIHTGLPAINKLSPINDRKISWIEQLVAVKRKFSAAPKTSTCTAVSLTFTNSNHLNLTGIPGTGNDEVYTRGIYIIEENSKTSQITSQEAFDDENDVDNTKSPKTSATELTPRHRTSSSGSHVKLTEKEMQLLKTIVVVITVFFACWTPYVIYNILRLFGVCQANSFVDCLTMWLGFSNSAMNPLLYGVLNGQFRCAILNIINIRPSRKSEC